MRFKIFGFKGELSTLGGQKKKKSKHNDDDVIQGGVFRTFSEFGPSTSRLKKSTQLNGSANIQQNGPNVEATKPKDWCGTTVPSNDKKEDNKATENKTQRDVKPILKKIPEGHSSQQELKAQGQEKLSSVQASESKVNAKIKHTEPGNKSDSITVQDVKETSEVKTDNSGKKFITIGGFDESQDGDSSEDEFGAKKTKKSKEKPLEAKSQQPTKEKQQSFGYSDQAASIFFRSDSPEPEQRVRNFSIKKLGHSDDEDNTSQTSV